MIMSLISSPIFSSFIGSAVGSALYSSAGTYPVCFLPISTWISLGEIPVTTPTTFCSVLILLRDSSSASIKSRSSAEVFATSSAFSIGFVFTFSDIVESTSFMIAAGVDAPAVTPTFRHPWKLIFFSSSAVSIR